MQAVVDLKFQEFPFSIPTGPLRLRHFVDFNNADLDLKIQLTEVILCRCFSPTSGIIFPDDLNWYIKNAAANYYADLPRPWITLTIKGAISSIMSADVFVKGIHGTTFMFGVIEFYAKNKFGWEPLKYDFFDNSHHKKYRDMSLSEAVKKVKKTNCDLARSLHKIDAHNVQRLETVGIEEHRYTKARIADRLTLARNTMLHGENHSFYDKGKYLVMLYFLFHYHDLKVGVV
jgi:hypothetical protein